MSEKIDKNEAELLEAMAVDDDVVEYKAVSGEPLKEGVKKTSKEAVIEAIRQVYDPEIPINVFDMGLIYDIKQFENGDVHIDMTLTAPGCPVAGILPQQVADAVAGVEGVGIVNVQVVWEPQWTIEKMTDEGRAMVDLF